MFFWVNDLYIVFHDVFSILQGYHNGQGKNILQGQGILLPVRENGHFEEQSGKIEIISHG